MPTANANLLLRNDTILGVCEAIGTDFGFHPNWLRLVLAGSFYWAPMAVIATYLVLGLAVAITRWVAPDGVEQIAPAEIAAPQSLPVADREIALAA